MSERWISLLERIAVAQEAQAQATQAMAERLDLLIQAMGEDEPEEPHAQPLTYMDGSLVRG